MLQVRCEQRKTTSFSLFLFNSSLVILGGFIVAEAELKEWCK